MQSPHAWAWLSEFAGTALLLFASVLVTWWLFDPRSALAGVVPGVAGRKAIEGALIGLVIGLLIISPLGRSSGGHFNPAVTVTFWLLRGLPGRDGVAYVAAQIVGSLVGLLLGWAVLGTVMADRPVDYAAIRPAAGWQSGAVFAGEAISLAILMAAVVVFLARPALMQWTPLVVAAVIAVLILGGGLTTGGSFNPARQLGPLLLAGRFSYLWAYLLGPLVGAITVAVLIRALGLRRPLTCSLCGVPPRYSTPRRLCIRRRPWQASLTMPQGNGLLGRWAATACRLSAQTGWLRLKICAPRRRCRPWPPHLVQRLCPHA